MPLAESAHAAGFVAPYAPANFTLTNNNADGSVNTAGAPASITLTGGDNGNGAGTTRYLTTAAAAGAVSFDWLYTSTDSRGFDDFGYLLNGTFTQLADTSGQTGFATFGVNAGDSFGFQVYTVDNILGRGSATITNFNGPVVPTPALLPGLIGMGVAAWRRRKAEAQAGLTEEA